jgi:hypothetical protein
MVRFVGDHGTQLLGRHALACPDGDVYARPKQPERERERPRVRDDAHRFSIEEQLVGDLVTPSEAARLPNLPNDRCCGR